MREAPRELPRTAPRAALTAASAAPQRQEPVARQAEPAAEVAAVALGRFEDLLALAAEKRDLPTKTALERDVRLVRFEDGKLEIALETGAAKTLVN